MSAGRAGHKVCLSHMQSYRCTPTHDVSKCERAARKAHRNSQCWILVGPYVNTALIQSVEENILDQGATN